MIKNKIKKITIILSIALLTICNFNCIFADEIEEDILQNNIKPKMLLNANQTPTGNIGKILNFNNITPQLLNIIYNKYNEYTIIRYDYLNNLLYLGKNETYIESGNYNIVVVDDNNGEIYYYDGTLKANTGWTSYIYKDNYSGLPYQYGFIKWNIPNNLYEFKPYKLNINNLGKGTITNNANYEPYASTNIYYEGQQITLTYDNQYDDFEGWYINGTKVSDNLSYTFNITSDITITSEPIYYEIPLISNVILWFKTIVTTILSFEIPIMPNMTLKTLVLYLFLTRLSFELIHIFLTKNHFWDKGHKAKRGSYGKDN